LGRRGVREIRYNADDRHVSEVFSGEVSKMQSWADRHPILFALSDFLFVYLTVSFVIAWWSGWAVLARQFRLRTKFVGSRWSWQSGNMRWLCGYANCLVFGANPQGLYLATLRFFPLFHPPLFIPWSEISVAKKSLVFSRIRLRLGREYSIPLSVRERLAEQLKAAAGKGYPTETLG
jgi:hypothetical protein